MTMAPVVSVVIPTYNEECYLERTLAAVAAQTYAGDIEVIVADGRSSDGTREIARARGALVVDNPERLQAAGLNAGIAAATGEIVVRVDGHCEIAPDYVERCVDALGRTGAAMVGGSMRPVGSGWRQRGIAAATQARLGAGPARFHRPGHSGWVDTVYLGAFRRSTALEVGGYSVEHTPNEDAEFAHRMGRHGGVWLDDSIRSSYAPRATFSALARQYLRYGRGRARTMVSHPDSISPRQLAAPALLVGLAAPTRRPVAVAYAAAVAAGTVATAAHDVRDAPGYLIALPVMHLSWGTGFYIELAHELRQRRPSR